MRRHGNKRAVHRLRDRVHVDDQFAFGPDGTMYVLEFAKNSVLNLATSPLGALYALKDGARTELVPGTLLAPGGVVVDGTTLYVTTRTVFGPGAGSVVRIELD